MKIRRSFVIAVSVLIYLIIIALLCYGLYRLTGLDIAFGLELGLLNWIGTVLIVRLILDQSFNQKLKEDDK